MNCKAYTVCCTLLGALGAGCDVPPAETGLPSPNAAEFQETVYPLLLRDCGFPACHGTSERFFQVFGPGRQRLSPVTAPYAPATPDELDLSYSRARSMLKGPGGLSDAPLLRKPLAPSAGGAGHRGNDAWDQNVYASKRDPGYRVLQAWARSGGAQQGPR